ncbi:MAG: putative DNA binding domain-containing protein [Spirochaetaceae bacterium]|nr:putative DNA binding domain-containing protein [Spirochaetaceae bacterium]
MSETRLAHLTALGEGFTTEFKRSVPSNLGAEVCAFANATGGVILIGVTDEGDAVGVENHNRLKSQVQTTARSADPPIAVEVESVDDVLVVTVPEQHGKPYSFRGRFYVREGANCQQMSRDEIRESFYKEGLIRFDETPCPRFDLQRDLTPEAWSRFAARARIPDDLEPLIALENLHLFRDGQMTQAGAWLLAEDVTKYSLQAAVTCALLRGVTKTHILDLKNFTGDLYSIYEECIAYAQAKLNTALIPHVHGRDERLELPEDAIREALVNAIAHRDYRSTANVQMYIFHDRLEIVTPGGLPAGMREEDLGIKSVPRNRLLFGMFHRMGMVEQIGSGIRRIRQECRGYGVAEPLIEVSEHWVTTTFKRPMTPAGARSASVTTEPGDGQIETEAGTKSAPSRHQVSILRNCLSDKSILELMAHTGRQDRTKFRNQVLKPLLKAGWLEMTVPDKPTSRRQKYRTTKPGRQALETFNEDDQRARPD